VSYGSALTIGYRQLIFAKLFHGVDGERNDALEAVSPHDLVKHGQIDPCVRDV